jgi:FkbM family methyltransferase
MKAGAMSRSVLQVRRSRVVTEFLMRRWVTAHRRRSRGRDEPRLFCMPEDHIGLSIVTGGVYERDLLTALFEGVLRPWRDVFRESTALDVGANIGNHACFLARRFRQVLAFEPSPTFVHLLHANRLVNKAHNLQIHPVGLGSEDAELAFVEHGEGNLGASSFVTDGATVGTDRLPVRRGDDYLRANRPVAPIALVKIDVEGFEIDVIRGLRDTLLEARPFVLFESSTSNGERGGEAVRALLSAMGYRHFYAVERRRSARGGLGRLIDSAIAGVDIWVTPVERLQDRYYSLILASADPIDASHAA